jgi:serine/threonine protein phosphatase PrpC
VWSTVEDREILECSAAADSPREFGRSLIDLAMERGSDDNVSAIVLQSESGPAQAPAAAGVLVRILGRRRR